MVSKSGIKQRIVVTVRPGAGHDGRLRVDDAMRQVLDFLRVTEDAKMSLGRVNENFEWLLDSASTNSPFTVVAMARALDPTVDVSECVRLVKSETSSAFLKFLRREPPPGWITPEGFQSMHSIIRRTANGVDSLNIDFDGEASSLAISHSVAEGILPELAEQVELMTSDLPARVAHGEITGILGSVGRYRGKPALYLRTNIYGNVWCVLPSDLIDQWADATRLSAVWKDRKLTVFGRLVYWQGGRLARVEAETVRERGTQLVDIRKLFDPDFTSGLDPIEYLEKLHEGRLG